MRIVKLAVVSPEEASRLWSFYDQVFAEVNEQTPLAQSYPKKIFDEFMHNEKVLKCIGYEKDEIVGLGLITTDPEAEPLISARYFHKHFPGRVLYYVLTIATRRDRRGLRQAGDLLIAMLEESEDDAMCMFLSSTRVNGAMTSFAEYVLRGKISGGVLDTEQCAVYEWAGQKNPFR